MGRPAKYPPEFRREAVALVKSSGRPVAEVARSLEIAEGTLWNWVKLDREATERDADPDALSESERVELKRLRKKTQQQEIDLEILRKAAAYVEVTPDFDPERSITPPEGWSFVESHDRGEWSEDDAQVHYFDGPGPSADYSDCYFTVVTRPDDPRVPLCQNNGCRPVV